MIFRTQKLLRRQLNLGKVQATKRPLWKKFLIPNKQCPIVSCWVWKDPITMNASQRQLEPQGRRHRRNVQLHSANMIPAGREARVFSFYSRACLKWEQDQSPSASYGRRHLETWLTLAYVSRMFSFTDWHPGSFPADTSKIRPCPWGRVLFIWHVNC